MNENNHNQVTDDDLDLQYQQSVVKANSLYRFVNLFRNVFYQRRDYAQTGKLLNMTEIHDLTFIADNPGTTATIITNRTLRTRGSVSQCIKRLENMDLIRRESSPENAKILLLYTTSAGKELSNIHKASDVRSLNEMHKVLRNKFSEEEIDCFYQILEYLVSTMQSWIGKLSVTKRGKKRRN